MNQNQLSESLSPSPWSSFYGAFASCSTSPYSIFLRYWNLNLNKKLLEYSQIPAQKENLGCCALIKDKGKDLVSECHDEGQKMKDHLVVLVNGIGGGPENWKYMEEQFRDRAAPNMMVHVSASNAYSKTLDGFDVMGKRLANEVTKLVNANSTLKKISFVSHSMGGLIARYAFGLLYRPNESNDKNLSESKPKGSDQNGDCFRSTESSYMEIVKPPKVEETFFNCVDFSPEDSKFSDPEYLAVEDEDNSPSAQSALNLRESMPSSKNNAAKSKDSISSDSVVPPNGTQSSASTDQIVGSGGTIAGLEPINFISIASPHLGCRGKGHFPILFNMELLESVGQKLAPFIGGRSGLHLFLGDGENPLLLRMSTDCEEGPFFSALACFRHRTLYSNASWDQMVGWRTSSIRRASEMPKLPKKESDPRYRHVMLVEDSKSDPPPMPSSTGKAPSSIPKSNSLSSLFSSDSKSKSPDSTIPESNSSASLMIFPNPTASNNLVLASLPKVKSKNGVNKLSKNSQKLEKKEWHMEMEEVMLDRLQKLSWKRVDVCFSSARLPFMAHNLIQVKNEWIHADGCGVIWHIIDHLDP